MPATVNSFGLLRQPSPCKIWLLIKKLWNFSWEIQRMLLRAKPRSSFVKHSPSATSVLKFLFANMTISIWQERVGDTVTLRRLDLYCTILAWMGPLQFHHRLLP